MAYWYEKENDDLLTFEKQCYLQLMKEYNHPDLKPGFQCDKKNQFCVDTVIPFKAELDDAWRRFSSHIVYEYDYSGSGTDGLFGRGIKVYPMTRLKPRLHHLITDTAMGLPYICQVRTAKSQHVNGYHVMTKYSVKGRREKRRKYRRISCVSDRRYHARY